MRLFETGRWPAIWDKADLDRALQGIVEAGPEFEAKFFQQGELRGGFACQGDIVEFRSMLPLISEDGEIVAADEYEHWMVLGNTCDMDRDEVEHSTIVPLEVIQPAPTEDKLLILRSYAFYRQFYVPPWRDDEQQAHRMAMFVNPVTIEKKAFRDDCARIVARLEFGAWALLHLCLVRYLARDDGRHD
ncbi:MAG TPA: hypothetical protein VNO30_29875 [Kofleriaceae bacterium]|nr:hypothetical protein [Kofleriaceae bacterium]